MSNEDILRILVVGVGGQGVVFASKVVGKAIMEAGHNVIMSEVHGMAQRGGVVTCHICIGDIQSPIIGDGEANIILAFEPIEAYRAIHKANSETVIITNKTMFIPTTAFIGKVEYPDLSDVLGAIGEVNDHLVTLNATKIAMDVGSHVMANAVLLGALSGAAELPIGSEELKRHMLTRVPPKTIDLNSRAFDLGLKFVMQS